MTSESVASELLRPGLLERVSVLLATNGREGVELFRREHERIALVLLDLTMPHMGGEEAFRRRKLRANSERLGWAG